MKKKLIGHIGVDAGLCWIGDPCYVLGDDASHRVTSWDDFCGKIDHKKGYTEPIGQHTGLAVATGYGDGCYPVHAEFHDGRVARITVDFMPEESPSERAHRLADEAVQGGEDYE